MNGYGLQSVHFEREEIMMAGIGAGLGLAGALFGGEDGGSPGFRKEGYAAMSPQMQALWDNWAGQLGQMQGQPGSFNAGQFNQFQQNAMNAFGNPDFSQAGLQKYLSPFQGQRDAQMGAANQSFDQSEGRLRGLFGSGQGKGGISQQGAAGLGQLAGQRAQTMGNIESQFQQQGLGLQRQSLFDQLNAGNQQYGLQEQNSPFGQMMRQMGMLQGLPGSSVQQGAQQGSPDWLSRLGGAGMYAASPYGQQFGQMFGGGGNQYGSPWSSRPGMY